MRAPPTRYKVVERGRRLEVIDTWTGQAATPRSTAAEQAPRRSATPLSVVSRERPARLTQSGQDILRTAAWYDAKGPREIVLGREANQKLQGVLIAGAVALIFAGIFAFTWWPLLLALGFILARGSVRAQLRAAATKFLDGLDKPA